jgi:sphinganine-1-phosphate aldolase
MREQIDSNTVCLVGSAPEYAFGYYDPLPEISAMAKEYGINCHVDCCLGSYINPFSEAAGFKLPCLYDFKLEGVTSISCDPHKFCYGPKGLSVIMFRTKELRRQSFFAVSNWPGGMYVTPTIAGSRPGAVIAGTWAALMKQGRQGFIDKAKMILTAAQNIREEIAKIPEIKVYSN